MKDVQALVDGTERYYARRAEGGDEQHRREYRLWGKKKEKLIFSMWAYSGQSKAVIPKSRCAYFGYKRPNNEFYFEFYEEHLKRRPPVYIYCIRNFVDNYLSIASRWPERKIAEVAKDYMQSIEQYHLMKKAAPDRVFPFVLDRHIEEGVSYLETHILQPLGLANQGEVLSRIASKGAVNTAEGKVGHRRRDLTRREQRFLNKRPDIANAFQAFLEN